MSQERYFEVVLLMNS